MRNRGLFIAFEGIDGSGKSTQIRLLGDWLRDQGYTVVATREPTSGPYGLQIRSLYADRDRVTLEEELELFISDRREHVEKVINPAVQAGQIVLTDRYYYSTAAYQGAAGLDPDTIFKKNSFAPEPDMVILLTMSPEESVARIKEIRGEKLNDFEQLDQLKKVAALFDGFNQESIVRVDGSRNITAVQSDIRLLVSHLLTKKKL